MHEATTICLSSFPRYTARCGPARLTPATLRKVVSRPECLGSSTRGRHEYSHRTGQTDIRRASSLNAFAQSGGCILNERIQLIALLTAFKTTPNCQLTNLQFVVVLHEAYFAYSRHRTRTGLPNPYVLPSEAST